MRPDADVLARVLRDAGLSYHAGQSAYVFTCPKCGKREKLHVRRAGKFCGYFICFSGRCQNENFRGPNTEYVLAPLLGVSPDEARELLGGKRPSASRSIELPWQQDQAAESEWPEAEHPPHHLDLRDLRAAEGLAYMVGRGVPLEVAEEYGVRYSPVRRRVVFPVVVDGRLLGWQGRSVTPTEWVDRKTGQPRSRPKYHTEWARDPRGVAPPVWLFQDRLLVSEHVVITEGPMDAIKAHLCGGNVGSMGKGAVAPEKLAALPRYGIRRVYGGLDPDAAERTGRLVRDFCGTAIDFYLIDVPAGRDLGAMSMEEVLDRFCAARLADKHAIYVFMRPTREAVAVGRRNR